MEPYEGGPGPEPDAEESAERCKLYEVSDRAFAPLMVGYLALMLAAVILLLVGLIVGSVGTLNLLIWAIVTLPMVAINCVYLVHYARRIRTPLGRTISGSAAFGAGVVMIALSVIAVVISSFGCAYLMTPIVGTR